MNNRRGPSFLGSMVALLLMVANGSAQAPLGTASSYAELAFSTVTNSGASIVTGNVGISPGSAVVGFPPGVIAAPYMVVIGGAAATAQADTSIAYGDLSSLPCATDLTGQDLGSLTLTPGVYCFNTSAQLTGNLTLDGQNTPGAAFTFQIGSTLTTASGSSVVLINGAQPGNVFWKVGSSATLGTTTAFQGNILASASITLNSSATLVGRALAQFGAVTTAANSITIPGDGGVGLLFYPLAPCRIADTRTTQPFTGAFGPPSLAAYSERILPILSSACSIPSTAVAYSLNFTVVPAQPLGFLSVWAAGSPFPGVSTLNSSDGATIANAAIVTAGNGGSIIALASNPTDLIIDINGYFAPATDSGQDFFPLTLCRVADTRSSQPFTGAFGPPSMIANVTRDFPINTSPCLSGSPQAYSLNLTVAPAGTLGFLSAWPAGQPFPGVSTLNSPDGTVLANAAILPAGTGGDIDVLASNNTDLIIDVNGVFATPAAGGLRFYPITPCRVADTRSTQPFSGAFGPPSLVANLGRNFPIQSGQCSIPITAQSYALNLTVVPPGPLSFLLAWPQGAAYTGASTLNSPDGFVIANAAIVSAGTSGGITMVASNTTDLIIDIVGYFAP